VVVAARSQVSRRPRRRFAVMVVLAGFPAAVPWLRRRVVAVAWGQLPPSPTTS
jgi:hypothetical protein